MPTAYCPNPKKKNRGAAVGNLLEDRLGEKYGKKRGIKRKQLDKHKKAVCFPLAAFAADIWAISSFRAFGTELIAPLSAAIWMSGLITGLILPSHRKTTLNETVIALVGYSVLLMGLRYALQLISGVSTEMLIASYGQIRAMKRASSIRVNMKRYFLSKKQTRY